MGKDEMKLLYLDLETTGVDRQNCAIHEVAAIMEIDGKIVDKIHLKMAPFKGAVIEQGAIEHAKLDPELIQTYPDQREQFNKFITFLDKHCDRFDKIDKMFVTGYNVNFDTDFIRMWFSRNTNSFYGSYFWSSNIDVMVLAAEFLRDIRSMMENFKLATVYGAFETLGLLTPIDKTKAHAAMFDIIITIKIYQLLRKENYVSTLEKLKEVKKLME